MSSKTFTAQTKLAQLIAQRVGFKIKKQHNSLPVPAQEGGYSRQGARPSGFVFDQRVPLAERALKREELKRLRQQHNIESILAQAMQYCPDTKTDGYVDPDWFERFMSLAEDSATASMQQLWAKILAGETLAPGTFSIKSLQTLKQMTQREALAIQKAAALCAQLDFDHSHIILLGYYKRPSLFDLLRKGNKEQLNLAKAGLSYPQILTLMDCAVLYRKEIESANFRAKQQLKLRFYDTSLTLTAKNSDLVLSYYKFTQTGDELRRLLRATLSPTFKQAIEQALQRDFDLEWS
tara:strand:- start:122 stop:1000 length:879 start_codon:yes stop_codon:yes gene_type:complete